MSDSGTETAPASQPHPRFAEALTALVFPLDPQTLIAHAGGRVVGVREQTS
ncbi:hypothetical protein [Streptomyces sp. A1-5]|uniref:hypothetical protein n=1 Tax=Streptomyces sp. A1-5 TaxID=2738410 RepID=UPI001F2CB5A3|nr:hypothetical protein [Streptomyces sp. A1-5]UJB42425.1 hypothetical protein HRD51_17755 [Streptomyces sp. A1-5]